MRRGDKPLRRATNAAIGPGPSHRFSSTQRFLDDAGCTVPVIKGPMYPGSNPELVAAVSAAGGLGVVQPISLTHLYGHDFREGLQLIKRLTDKPFGVNFTILENKKYKKQMDEWMHIAADEGVKFFLTSLGKPDRMSPLRQRVSRSTTTCTRPRRRRSRRWGDGSDMLK